MGVCFWPRQIYNEQRAVVSVESIIKIQLDKRFMICLLMKTALKFRSSGPSLIVFTSDKTWSHRGFVVLGEWLQQSSHINLVRKTGRPVVINFHSWPVITICACITRTFYNQTTDDAQFCDRRGFILVNNSISQFS